MKKPVDKATQNLNTESGEHVIPPSQMPVSVRHSGNLNQHERATIYAQYVIFGRSIRQIARQFGATEQQITDIIFDRLTEDVIQRERRRAQLAREREVAAAFPVRKATA